jgi:protein ImuA
MTDTNTDIIARLRRDLLPLQGFKPVSQGWDNPIGWGPVDDAFPNREFPLGAVHEFLCTGPESAAASSGFMGSLIAALMRKRGVALWIGSSATLFPPGLKNFGIEPDRIIFIDLKKEKDIIYAMEEALKCDALTAVVGEVREISFTASRRLQLAVEQSRVTGFLFRNNPQNLNTTACVSRWKITPLPSVAEDGMPGLGFPRWQVELLKIRNGRPGTWQIEWAAGKFKHLSTAAALMPEPQKKTG